MSMFKKKLALGAVAIVASLAMVQSASAATGLKGAYYDTDGVYNLAMAADAIAGKTADATFTATKVCYPSCHGVSNDNTALNDFLGGNATNISANSIGNLQGHVLTLSGFINILTAGTYEFWLGSDDGSSLSIGGDLLSNDGLHGYQGVSKNFTLSAGLHAINIVQFENGGDTALTVKMNGTPISGDLLQTAPVPEPATWAMMIGGFGLAGAAMRRRARPAMTLA